MDSVPVIPIGSFEIFANGLDHPECLAFDRDGVLWAGGEAGQVYRIAENRLPEAIAQLGGFCGGMAWAPDDSHLYVCNPTHGIVKVNRSGEWSVFASEAGGMKLVCPNYGLFDRAGNYYVTDSGNWMKRNGRLIRYPPNGSAEVLLSGLGYANGLALSASGKRLYMVESDADLVYSVELSSGQAEVYADAVGRLPDGLALDTEGNLYVACYASDNIIRISPSREKTLFAYDRWAILLSRPTNLAFHDGYVYVANLGRYTITRARVPDAP